MTRPADRPVLKVCPICQQRAWTKRGRYTVCQGAGRIGGGFLALAAPSPKPVNLHRIATMKRIAKPSTLAQYQPTT